MDLMVSMKAQAREMVQEASRNAEEIINLAQRDAEKITSEAQAGAQDIAADAKIKAEKYWMNAEQEMAQKRKEEEDEKTYLDSPDGPGGAGQPGGLRRR